MSEAPVPASAADDGKKSEAVRVLGEILARMGVRAGLDAKELPDGSISIAVMVEGEVPGLAPGKRGHLLEALQFLLNKIVNRAPQPRRWVNLGVGDHPPPRPAPTQQPPQQKAPRQAPAQPAGAPAQQAKKPAAEKKAAPQRGASPPARAVDEAALEVPEDAELEASARALAEKSARHGRLVALLGLSAEDRARVHRAVRSVEGVSIKLEGEGRNRRLAIIPDKPSPMPKQVVPDYGEDDEDEQE